MVPLPAEDQHKSVAELGAGRHRFPVGARVAYQEWDGDVAETVTRSGVIVAHKQTLGARYYHMRTEGRPLWVVAESQVLHTLPADNAPGTVEEWLAEP